MDEMSVCTWPRSQVSNQASRAPTRNTFSGGCAHTDVQQNRAIELLVHDMCLEHLVVKRLRGTFGGRHGASKRCVDSGDDLSF